MVLVVVAVALVIVLQFPDRVHAGPVESLAQLALHPSEPDVMVLRYKNGGDGLFYTDDGGASWNVLCQSALETIAETDINRGGPIHVTADGHTLLGVYEGLFEDAGNGCGWQHVADVASKWVSDFADDPSDPGVSYLVTAMGGEGAMNSMIRRDADGSYATQGIEEEIFIGRLAVAAIDGGVRFYQSAIRGNIPATIDGVETEVPNYLIRVSDDGGMNFTEFAFSAPPGETFRMLGVDPTNPDRIVALVARHDASDDVLVSADRGETFEPYLQVSEFGAIAFAPDGRVWIGEAGVSTSQDASVGLWAAASLDAAPEKILDAPVQCLGYQPATDTLFACQRWTFGSVDPSSGEFTETFRFDEVQGFVSCEGVDMAASCEAQLCGDYCTFGHFARAPMCAAYNTPQCGVCVAAMETGEAVPECEDGGGSGGESGSGGTSGAAGASGSSGSGSAGMMAGTAGTAAAGTGAAGSGDSGAPPADAGGSDAGGCSYAGGTHDARGAGWLAGALVAAAFALRRRGPRA